MKVTFFALLAACASFSSSFARELTFEDRVRAQEAIERVYYAHQIGAMKPFEEAVPKAAIEKKVRASLETPIAIEDLSREWERIQAHTRMPERLREITDALGDDPELIRECLVRPLLATGVVDGFVLPISADAQFEHPVQASLAPSSSCVPLDTWRRGILDDAPPPLKEHVAVWTGSVMIVWGALQGGTSFAPATGQRYDPATDTWAPISSQGGPRVFALPAVWTGSQMLVLGSAISPATGTVGGRYDPVSNSWSPMSTVGAPTGLDGASVVWTGSRMILWGAGVNPGRRYDPVTDTWSAISTVNAPVSRDRHTAVWTGSRMIVWGGSINHIPFPIPVDSGGSYDPVADTWTATSLTGAPQGRSGHVAVWTGSRMLVWGGATSSGTADIGGRYDPVTDTWSAMTLNNQPPPRSDARAVWTGSVMIVWGNEAARTGGRYDPQSNTWALMDTSAAPVARRSFTMVWTGQDAIVWGGTTLNTSNSAYNSGGRYNPATNVWTATNTVGPVPRGSPLAVWTGNVMIVFDGGYPDTSVIAGRYDPVLDSWAPTAPSIVPSSGGQQAVWTGEEMLIWVFGSGERYNPVLDTWSSMSTVGAPNTVGPTLVWTGHEALAWGGTDSTTHSYVGTGKRYNPLTDSWSPMSNVGAPSPRGAMSAVWTGSRAIIWGGVDSPSHALRSGGLYDPVTDTWSSTNQDATPDPRYDHLAAWTGTEMIVLGGFVPNPVNPNVGGRYDPATDSWGSTAAQSLSSNATSVWTGTRMIVWGGSFGPGIGSGASYDVADDSWTATSTVGAPQARTKHAAIWTGSDMIVWGGEGPFGSITDGGLYSAADRDDDAVSDSCDNCPDTANVDQADADHDALGDACDPDDDNDTVVDGADNCSFVFNVAQRDTDGDGRGDFCDNCPNVMNPGQTDTDGDGAGNACDCDPADPLKRRPPDVGGLTLAGVGAGGAELSWSPAAAASSYAVTRGILGSLSTTVYGSCIASGLSQLAFTDSDVPGPGQGYSYLVQAVNASCGGPGPLGYTSTEAERVNADPGACAP